VSGRFVPLEKERKSEDGEMLDRFGILRIRRTGSRIPVFFFFFGISYGSYASKEVS